MGSGVIGASGGPPGALAGGAGELLAEAIEGSLGKSSFLRVPTEAALGAVPFAKLLKSGKAAASAVRGGSFNAVGDVGRQWAEGNFDTPDQSLTDLASGKPAPKAPGWNYGRTALATLLGGTTAGVVGKYFHGAPRLPNPPIPSSNPPLLPQVFVCPPQGEPNPKPIVTVVEFRKSEVTKPALRPAWPRLLAQPLVGCLTACPSPHHHPSIRA